MSPENRVRGLDGKLRTYRHQMTSPSGDSANSKQMCSFRTPYAHLGTLGILVLASFILLAYHCVIVALYHC